MTPTEIVRTFISSLEAQEYDRAFTLIGADCEYDNVPMSKTFGREAIRQSLEGFLTSASVVDWVIVREAATGNIVFNERIDRFKMAHGWVEIPVTGVWEVVDGHIVLWRDYFDLATFQRQMP
jgi:limonene-1,2-epoxide hydrolase